MSRFSAVTKLLIEKGVISPAGILPKDRAREGNVSKVAEADSPMTMENNFSRRKRADREWVRRSIQYQKEVLKTLEISLVLVLDLKPPGRHPHHFRLVP